MINNFIKFLVNISSIVLHLFKQYRWIFLGFFMVFCYVWFRFLRSVLPKTIPIDLNLVFLVGLLCNCVLYVYTIYRIIKPKLLPQILLDLLQYPVLGLNSFVIFVKDQYLGENNYKNLTLYLAKFIPYRYIHFKIVILLANILPHVFLISILLLDIFCYASLYYFYKFIWITLSLFLLPFIIKSVNYQLESLITYWIKNCDSVLMNYIPGILPPKYDYCHDDYEETDEDEGEGIPIKMRVDFETFIKIYCEYTSNPDKEIIDYVIFTTREWFNLLTEKLCREKKLPTAVGDARSEIIEKDIRLILKLYTILKDYRFVSAQSSLQLKLKIARIIIYIIYFAIWFYVLFISVSTQNILDLLELLKELSCYIDDIFSGDRMQENNVLTHE